MYRDALQFRTSHYFVSYLSEAAAVLSGFGAQPNGEWIFNVSEPHSIELPHSLVQVVIFWNKHMHKWLKNCTYFIQKFKIRLLSFKFMIIDKV